MVPDFSSFQPFQFRLQLVTFSVMFSDDGLYCRQVLVVLHLHQREEERIIFRHHIISDALGVDTVSA